MPSKQRGELVGEVAVAIRKIRGNVATVAVSLADRNGTDLWVLEADLEERKGRLQVHGATFSVPFQVEGGGA